jgi:DNA repair photolyase
VKVAPDEAYGSPRWSNEFLDCAMPMTFDTYSHCGFGCLYCFSLFQKTGAALPVLRWVRQPAVERLFLHPAAHGGQFKHMIMGRYAMQWGGLSDPFCRYEQQYGKSLGLLRFFAEQHYPVSISTKGSWIMDDARYMELLAAGTYHVKVSIINLDEDRARRVEVGVQPPVHRLEFIRRLARAGVPTTLRFRPFIHGISDRNGEHLELVRRAHDAGASNVSFEFMCLEVRKSKILARPYRAIGNVAGKDLVSFYRQFSQGSGYLRLNRAIKLPVVQDLAEQCDKLGMDLLVSDAHVKDFSAYAACCGIPRDWHYFDQNHMGALMLARATGRPTTLSQVCPSDHPLRDVPWERATGLNTASSQVRSRHRGQSMLDYMREAWDTPRSAKSPCNYFKCMRPTGLVDGEVAYEYTPAGKPAST